MARRFSPCTSSALPGAQVFTGIDWAAAAHAVCVMNAAGKVVAEFTVERSADGIAMLVRRLARYGDPADAPVAIERPDGRLLDPLLEAGHPVVPVKPNAIKTWRDGEVLSGARADAGDAAVIAEYLRLRYHRLQPPCRARGRPGRCAPWSVPVMVWWTCGSPPLTSSPRCWTRTGPEPGHFRRRGIPDQPGVPDPLPGPGIGPSPRREADGHILGQARLFRPPRRGRPSGTAPPGPGRDGRRGPHRSAARRRPGPGDRPHGAQRSAPRRQRRSAPSRKQR